MNSILIAVEGIDGSGKSTLVKYIEDELKKEGRQVARVATREMEREHIYQSVMDEYAVDINLPAGMFFFQMLHANKADRIRRALMEGKIVIADRWDLSFFVWHENFGFFSKESVELREGVSRLAFGDLKPNLGIYLDVSVDKALERRMWRKDFAVDLEKERRFYNKIITSYKSLVQRHGWITVDANNEFDQVWQQVWQLVKKTI